MRKEKGKERREKRKEKGEKEREKDKGTGTLKGGEKGENRDHDFSFGNHK